MSAASEAPSYLPAAHFVVAGKEGAKVSLPRWVWLLTCVLAVAGFFSPNPLLTPFAIMLLVLFPALLWRRSEPPVLVFACGMQWIQAAGIIFYANAYHLSLTEVGGSEIERATWLSLIAVAVNALGMKLMLLRAPPPSVRPQATASRVLIPNAFIFYVASFVIGTSAERLAVAIPSLAQPFYAVALLKWVAIFILFYAVTQQRRGEGFLITALVFEFAIGLLGYFASFKFVFFVLLVASLTTVTLRRSQVLKTAAIVLILLATGIVWSAVKQDYREFLNQGSGEQEILVPMDERGAKLSELVGNVSWQTLINGLDLMMLRVSQVSFFAATLENVPAHVPYTGGELWRDAIKRVVTPRIFFPDKAMVDDSERTILYADVKVSGFAEGTSMGIGYVAESYVDFGPVLMFVPILLLGMFYGLIYRLFVFSRETLLGYAIATAILSLGAYTIETSNVKLVGSNMTAVLVIGILYLLFRRVFMGWLTFSTTDRETLPFPSRTQ